MEKKAILLRKDHIGNPIQASLSQAAETLGWEVFNLDHDTSEYDKVLLFHNQPIEIKGTQTAWWMADLRPPYILPKYSFSNIFICNQEYIKTYERDFGTKVYYMPQCGDDRPIRKGRDFGQRIVFIGNLQSQYHQNRHELLSHLQKLGERLALISGEGYSVDTKGVYKAALVSLAISPQALGYTSNRVYNILSSGGFCLTLWFPGIEDLFENHKHLVWFKEKEELKDLLDRYRDPASQKEIRQAGKELYESKHTALHRLKNMEAIMNGESAEFAGYL